MVVIISWQIRLSCYLVTKFHCRDLGNHLTIVLLHGAQPSEIFCVRKSFCGKIFARPAESEVVDVELVDEIQVHEHAEGGLPRLL